MRARLFAVYEKILRALVIGLMALSGAAVLGMMFVTCADVIVRMFGRALTGAYDIVSILGVIAIAAALPYTTAVKGHVAIEYFFHKLPWKGRVAVDTVVRLMGMALFGVLARRCFLYGASLRDSGQVTVTLQVPLFWVPWLIALSCIAVALVIFENLIHPGREMIKP